MKNRTSAALLAFSLAFGQAAHAAPQKIPSQKMPFYADENISYDTLRKAPIGYTEMCAREPAECRDDIKDYPQAQPLKLTPKLWRLLQETNTNINAAMAPMNDIDRYQRDEYWTRRINTDVGDCEDLALEKRFRLSLEKLPIENLLLTVVKNAKGEGHVVLSVRTDRGMLALDIENNDIKRLDQTGYTLLGIQHPNSPNLWADLSKQNNLFHAPLGLRQSMK